MRLRVFSLSSRTRRRRVRDLLSRNLIVARSRIYCVYIASNKSRAIYVGITSDLMGRMPQHRSRSLPGHTSKYRIDRLIYFETTEDVRSAVQREKQIKGWRREKKVRLIESQNPTWEDLAAKWFVSTNRR